MKVQITYEIDVAEEKEAVILAKAVRQEKATSDSFWRFGHKAYPACILHVDLINPQGVIVPFYKEEMN